MTPTFKVIENIESSENSGERAHDQFSLNHFLSDEIRLLHWI
jgi:hypothetical protein